MLEHITIVFLICFTVLVANGQVWNALTEKWRNK